MICKSIYLENDSAELFTLILLPDENGKYPTVIRRSPYVDTDENKTEEELREAFQKWQGAWAEDGYAVVFQHCRGRGKSSGECVPYLKERDDGLFLQAWIRTQPFYNGDMFLVGESYCSSVHYVTAPFADDIKGLVLGVQDCERYNCNYRNGVYKVGLHGGWYTGMYKRKQIREKNYSRNSFLTLPLMDFPITVFGEHVPDMEEVFRHPDRDDPFWTTSHYAGAETHDAVKNNRCPLLLVTAFYDIFTGGVFDMWNTIPPEMKGKCALAVNPYSHSGFKDDQPLEFPDGELRQSFGDYERRWCNAVLGKEDYPFERGKVTYYRLFENRYATDDFYDVKELRALTFGKGDYTYTYNPFDPTPFKGGLCTNFSGCAIQDKPNFRYDVRSFYTEPFSEDTFIKGEMEADITVASDCEDTCFYMRLSLEKPEGADGDYGLRDDIHKLSEFAPDYVPGDRVKMHFRFDEHAFQVKAGQRLRIDISSSAWPWYLRHTNIKGPMEEQTTAKIAHNTICLDDAKLYIPAEIR
ncbi:MAG: hypothetical protein MJ175_09980 [Clostridia bacterium]|nr:hypothetical protein [Clostridia bacterium]